MPFSTLSIPISNTFSHHKTKQACPYPHCQQYLTVWGFKLSFEADKQFLAYWSFCNKWDKIRWSQRTGTYINVINFEGLHCSLQVLICSFHSCHLHNSTPKEQLAKAFKIDPQVFAVWIQHQKLLMTPKIHHKYPALMTVKIRVGPNNTNPSMWSPNTF